MSNYASFEAKWAKFASTEKETRAKLCEKCSKLGQTSQRAEMHLRCNCVIVEEL